MRGIGRASSAVTVLNALSTGVGCAIGIRRFVQATVEPLPEDPGRIEVAPQPSRTNLVDAAAQAAIRRYSPKPVGARIVLRSDIPAGQGLKSSSAVASAIVFATARAMGVEPAPEEVARLSAEVGRSSGVSATGAFDDALAGLVTGFVLTDNRADRTLSVRPSDPAWVAVVGIPGGTHARAPMLRDPFEAERDSGRMAETAAREGRWMEAITENGRLVERVLGYRYEPTRERLLTAGALAVGVSGLGPAFWAIAPRDSSRAVLHAMPGELPERFVAEFTEASDAP
jgi:shikimate kinase